MNLLTPEIRAALLANMHARRKPGFAELLHFISPLRVRPAASTGLSGRSRRPPRLGGAMGFWAVLEALMVLTFQPPFFAGLSGYVAEMAGAFICAALGIVPSVRHADYIGSWLKLCSPRHKVNNREVSIM